MSRRWPHIDFTPGNWQNCGRPVVALKSLVQIGRRPLRTYPHKESAMNDRRASGQPGALAPRREFLRASTLAAAGAWWGGTALASRGAAADDTPAKPLGVALVGLGGLSGGQLAPALQKTKHCKLTALVSGHPDKARQWAEKYSVSPKNIYNYDNYDTIAGNPEIDMVYVVLPNSMHAEYTIRAAKAGKHVLCEKPMANSVAECQAMIKACADAQRMLAIGYRLHFDPYHQELIRLARSKAFGPLKIVEAGFGFKIGDPNQWRLKKALAGGGAMMDVGIYALQACRYLTGEEPVSVVALETKTDPVKFKEVDESIAFTLQFKSGTAAICGTSYNTGFNRVRANAENGWFELDPAYSYGGLAGRTSRGEAIKFAEIDQFAAEMDDFAQNIRAGKTSSVSGEEGLRDLKVIEAIYQSIASGKAVTIS